MKTPVVIVGGGPGGTACAMYLKRNGVDSVIVERAQFPRYHIGESMSGEAGAIVRDLGLEDAMMKAGHPVKHGVNVWGTNGENRWWVPVMQRLDDGSLKEQFTWQVRRSEFDKMMLDTALERGATLVSGKARQPIVDADGTVKGVEVLTDDGDNLRIESEMLLDCSGQATWLASRGVAGPKYLGSYDQQIAVFTHIKGLRRDAGGERREDQPGNTMIFYRTKFLWAWAIPIDDEITSVGIVSPLQYYRDKGESLVDYITRELRELNPELAARTQGFEFADKVHVIPNYSLQIKDFAGRGYICVGDAHRFIDPIFSFGLYVTMKEAQLIGDVVPEYLNGKNRDADSPFEDYMIKVERAADTFEDTIDTFWENPLAFAWMAHRRHVDDIIDVFAGRVFNETPSRAVQECRKLLKRERIYEPGGDYSVPVGSRYRPERGAIWNASLDGIETTESWMRDNES